MKFPYPRLSPRTLAIAGAVLALSLSTTLRAEVLTNVFTGVIPLNGDISSFFETNGVTLKPGVCLTVDATPLASEPPLSGEVTKSGNNHPSGFNQRRILSAYNPTLNGGTIFVGVDLPGGTGSIANPNFADADGPTRVGVDGMVAIRPFDADGNGEAETIGYDGLVPLRRCSDFGISLLTSDIIDCGKPLSGGFTDAVDPDIDPGNKERYGITITFGDGTQVQVELSEDNFTPPGKAHLLIGSIPGGKTFGAWASTDVSGAPLGFDVEFAITNVNANVSECARLVQTVSVNSGSLQDGSPNGEDFNVIRCIYVLPVGIDITKSCPPTAPSPGQPLVFTGTVRNTGAVTLTNVLVVNNQPVPNTPVFGPVTLAPGQVIGFTNSYIVPQNYTNCSISDTLTATASDLCSNRLVSATASAICPVMHTLTIFCPSNLFLQCIGNVPPPDFAGGTAVSSADNVTVIHLGDVILTNGCARIIQRTYQATDGCTNRATCTQIIAVQDTLPPVITCQPNRTNEWVTGAVPVFGDPTATDNCDTNLTITFADDQLPAICPFVRLYRRTWTATDDCTNRASCAQLIAFVDTTPPVITCQPNRTNEWVVGAVPVFGDPTASDTCDTNVTITFVDDQLPANCPAVRIFRRTWTATDDCTNRASCAQLIVFVDTTPPVITCQPNRTNEWVVGAVAVFGEPQASDTCDTNVTVTFVDDQLPANCPLVRIVRRTWTATDDCTNRASCAQIIVFVDTTPPVITCQPNRTNEWVTGAVPVFGNPQASDTCDTNVTITFVDDQLPATCPVVRVYRRTWTATDDCTNSASCAQLIVFVDTTPPILIGVPGGTNVQCLADLPPLPTVSAIDACDTNVPVTLTSITNGACPTIILHIWSAFDDCSNRVSATITNIVLDTIPPVLVGVPTNQSYQCLGDVPPPPNVTATDNCDGVLPVTTTYVTNGVCPTIITCTWRAQDRCTNSASATRTITINDTIPPVLVGVPTNQSYQCLGDVPPPANVTATDNCDGNIPVTTTYVTNGICPTIITCTWRAQDRCTNSASATRTITVNDTIPPVLVGVPTNQTYQCPSDVPPPANVTATDNCDGNIPVTTTYVTNGVCPTIITCTWRAQDRCTNSASATRTITIQPPPVVVTSPLTNVVACVGESAQFCVLASQSCGVTYTWTRNGTIIEGARSNCLVITSVTTNHAGVYCVIVSGPCNSVTNCATLSLKSSVGDFVWEDLDQDGCQDPNEPGVSNVVVQLIGCGTTNAIRTTTTDGTGHYQFDCVEPGNYRVHFYLPSSQYMFTTQTNPVCAPNGDSDPPMDTGISGCFNLPPGTTDLTHDAGLVRKAALGDFVWLDLNGNGMQDMSEPGVSNVLVQLMDCMGNVLRTTNTDANGYYLFTDLPPGRYKVTFVLPPGFTFTLPDVPPNDAIDSDANPINGMTGCYTLGSGETNRTVDAGLVVPACIDIEKYIQRYITSSGGEGLTPGFWKNHSRFGPAPLAGWPQTGYDPLDSYEAIFGVDVPGTPTLLDALNTGGGGLNALLRHSTAALLNSAHPNISFLFTTAQVIDMTRTAINSGDAGQIESAHQLFATENEREANINSGGTSQTTLGPLEDADVPPGIQLASGDCGVFTYVVTNCSPIELTNIVVLDDNATPGFPADDFLAMPRTTNTPAGVFNVGDTDRDHRLDPGERWLYTANFCVSASGQYCNLAFVTGTPVAPDGTPTGGIVTDRDTACWSVPSNCTPRLTITLTCASSSEVGAPIQFSGSVSNAGNTTITNITITSSKAGVLQTVPSLDPGQTASFGGSYTPTNCGAASANTVTASGFSTCVGSPVTASATASCSVPCPPQAPGGCRVTGGSNRETNTFQAACITTPLPSHVSHGGQVGAPFSVGTPFTPNSPCISGEWEHNRHTRNGNHLVGTFHASGNGHEHQFDSLLCACLPCPESPNAVGVVGGLCNPGDRVCGPEPRRAGANKICFSGVGDYTFTSGKKTVKAVFRVDIEDRGEGNSHANPIPPDRYRIRLWILDPSCGRNPDPNSAEAIALRIAASADPATIATLATTEDLKVNIPPDIDDGGNMVQGNHQIHPATGSICGAITPPALARVEASSEVALLESGGPGAFGITALGIQTSQNPTFVYRVTITNSGAAPLTNLTVTEIAGDTSTDVSGAYFLPGTALAPGAMLTRFHTNTLDAVDVRTVLVGGQSGQDATAVIASSTTVATVVPPEPLPPLSITFTNENFRLEWNVGSATGVVLEMTTNLSPNSVWIVIPNAVSPATLSRKASIPMQFYRLRQP